MQKEMTSIYKNNTWQIETLPTSIKPISSKWVYKTKPSPPGFPPIRKARLVARGFQQKLGLDYQESFAPVIKWVTIRATVALAAANQ